MSKAKSTCAIVRRVPAVVSRPDEMLRYRRLLMHVFRRQRIARDDMEDLLQTTYLQALKKIRLGGLDDPGNLDGYLVRTAFKLAAVYWRRRNAHQFEHDEIVLERLPDDSYTPAESLERDWRARDVRALIGRLRMERDREVLERVYLHEEPRSAIRESMNLTELRFNVVLDRARHRFVSAFRAAVE